MFKKLLVVGAGLGVAVIANVAFPEAPWMSAGNVVESVGEPAPIYLVVAGFIGLVLVRKRTSKQA